jgi:hypothetical protein
MFHDSDATLAWWCSIVMYTVFCDLPCPSFATIHVNHGWDDMIWSKSVLKFCRIIMQVFVVLLEPSPAWPLKVLREH